MTGQLARAKREDKKALSNHAADSRRALHQLFRGEKDEESLSALRKNVDEGYLMENARWMKIVRERYQGSVIRRTGNSLDYLGQPISGLEPYDEHICLLKLYAHEYSALDTLARQSLDGSSFSRTFSSQVGGGSAVTMQIL